MHPIASTFLGASLSFSSFACVVERAGLGPADGSAPIFDVGVATDFAIDVDSAGDVDANFGDEDFGVVELGVLDSGGVDLGGKACGDLGVASHRSCLELRDDPCLSGPPSGRYTVDVDGAGVLAPVEVYCDMSTDGGGWTLVGRTTGGSAESFGWTTTFGAVDADMQPYSLGLGAEMAFSEVLFGKRGGGKAWGDRVYAFAVTPNFVRSYAETAYAVPALRTVIGTCAPPGGPSMLRYVGHTEADYQFFFRDSTSFDAAFGMQADEFTLTSNTCGVSGELHRNEGMIMVR